MTPMAATQQCTARLPPKAKAVVEDLAKKAGKTTSAFLKDLILDDLRRRGIAEVKLG